MKTMIKSKIFDYLKKVIKEKIEIEVFVPENEQFGHYSSNVALKLATLARKNADLNAELRGKNPMQIAEEIKTALSSMIARDFFEKIEVATPGFINFWISEKVLQDELKEILKKKQNYGKSAVRGQI